jgi:hypothetical protein
MNGMLRVRTVILYGICRLFTSERRQVAGSRYRLIRSPLFAALLRLLCSAGGFACK